MENKETMLGKIMGKIVGLPLEVLRALYDLVEKLASGNEWLAELKKFLRKEKCWTDVIIETVLDLIGTVDVPARTEEFIARDNFVVDTSKKAKVKISYLGDNFKKNFLDKLDKRENPIAKTMLCYHRHKKWLRSIPIINALGGDDKAETMLTEMFGLMELQPDGRAGALLVNGYANIFFIRDVNGELRAVSCRWLGLGWRLFAREVDYPYLWNAGNQVFSRNPSEN